jgi:FG-GAP-like repeat
MPIGANIDSPTESAHKMLTMLPAALVLLLWFAVAAVVVTATNNMQPRKVITVESHPARHVFGSVSAPEGSPWCQGRPMYWLVGHQTDAESPYCLSDAGHWVRNPLVVLDSNDPLNDIDGPNCIDRHDCTAVDVNGDGMKDLVCGVGANKGSGFGYNEVYITQPNGTLQKVLDGHGLHRYPTLRVRIVESLSDPFGNPLVFLATQGIRRADHATNTHKLFRRVFNETPPGTSSSATTNNFFFEDAADDESPLTRYTEASVVVVADFNGDQIDDLLVGNRNGPALLFIQHSNGRWEKSPLQGRRRRNWRSARLADFSGDGIADLIVSDWGQGNATNSTITIFRGMATKPYFDCTVQGVLFEQTMPYATPSIAVFDADKDGRMDDIYVVQTDEGTPGSYCVEGEVGNRRQLWGRGNKPPASYVPPLDEAHDFLLVAKKNSSSSFGGDNAALPLSFQVVTMDHAEPGCGFMVERFHNHSLLLAQGSRDRLGHNLLVEW